MSNHELEGQIIDFTAKQTSTRSKNISLKTRLGEDLGIDGDDAVDFLEQFSIQFSVDLSDLEFNKHFGPEGGVGLISLFLWLFSRIYSKLSNKETNQNKFIPITIQDLVCAAVAKRWIMRYDDSSKIFD